MRKSSKSPAGYESNLRSLRGTFAAEGIVISEETRKNLDRMALEGVSYTQIIAELKEKYTQR